MTGVTWVTGIHFKNLFQIRNVLPCCYHDVIAITMTSSQYHEPESFPSLYPAHRRLPYRQQGRCRGNLSKLESLPFSYTERHRLRCRLTPHYSHHWSKVPRWRNSRTPVQSTEAEFSVVERLKGVKNPGEKLYAPLVQSSDVCTSGV